MISMQKLNDWTGEVSPSTLSHDLREGGSDGLRRRRAVAALNLVAIGSMAAVAMYQIGLIRHLPEPPLRRLDADRIDAAAKAYRTLSAPDAVIGLRSYATTLALVSMGGEDRAHERPWIPIALAAKSAADAIQAGKLTRDQWVDHRSFCSYCLVAAGATFAALPLVLPEAAEALRTLWRRSADLRH